MLALKTERENLKKQILYYRLVLNMLEVHMFNSFSLGYSNIFSKNRVTNSNLQITVPHSVTVRPAVTAKLSFYIIARQKIYVNGRIYSDGSICGNTQLKWPSHCRYIIAYRIFYV